MHGSGDIGRLLHGVIPVLGSLAIGNVVYWDTDSLRGRGARSIIGEYLINLINGELES